MIIFIINILQVYCYAMHACMGCHLYKYSANANISSDICIWLALDVYGHTLGNIYVQYLNICTNDIPYMHEVYLALCGMQYLIFIL